MLKHRKRKIFITNLQLMASVGAYDDEKKTQAKNYCRYRNLSYK